MPSCPQSPSLGLYNSHTNLHGFYAIHDNNNNNSNHCANDNNNNDIKDNQNYHKSQLFNVQILIYLLLWYAVSSLTTQLTKSILNDFEFPVFVGEFQFLFNFILGFATIKLATIYPAIKLWFPISTFPTNNQFILNKSMFKLFFPMGTFQFIGKLFSLAATSVCTIATVSSIRALSPLFIVLGYRLHYKVLFPTKTYISLIPLLLGVIIIVLSQANYQLNSNHSPSQVNVYDEQLKVSELIDTSNNNNNDVSIHIDSLKKRNDVDDIISSSFPSSSSSSSSSISLFSFLRLFFENNEFQLQGIFYSLLSTSVFAAGSIYAKNVISNNSFINTPKEKKEIAKLALFSTESSANLTTIDLEKNHISNNQNINYINQKFINVDKLTTLMYCSLYGLVYSIPTFLTYELPLLLSSKLYPHDLLLTESTEAVSYYALIPWKLLIINGFSYFTQSLLAFHILGMLPTVTYSIANMMKRIIVIAISMILRGQHMGILEWLGLMHITFGLYVYEKWGAKQK